MDRDLVLDLIRELDPEITDIRQVSIRGLTPAIYLSHKRLGQAPLSVFGDALRRAVLLAAMIVSLKDGGILLIDEVETGFHVSVLERVFRWIAGISRQLDVQIVATTQNLEAVDAMAVSTADGKTDLVAYHLDQTMAETQVKRIDGDLLRRLRRERGLDVR
jgi:AAA15 family ATPase/GTPase